jgi:hypothetical protein
MRRGLHPAGVVPCTDSPRTVTRHKLATLGISINRIPASKTEGSEESRCNRDSGGEANGAKICRVKEFSSMQRLRKKA